MLDLVLTPDVRLFITIQNSFAVNETDNNWVNQRSVEKQIKNKGVII